MKHREEFFPTLFNRKGAFSSSSSARSPATCKELNRCNKKENSGSISYTFVVVLPSRCLWTSTLVEVGVPLQLRDCPEGLGSMVPVLLLSSIPPTRCVCAGGRPCLLTLCGLGAPRGV